MKNILFLVTFACCSISFAQEKEDLTIITDEKTVDFAIIENVPIYNGCDENLSNAEHKKCMNSQINNHIASNFDINVVKGKGIPDGKVKINVFFKINTEGNIIDIKARSPYPILEEEAIRVIKLIPKFLKPGFQKGEAVTVPYFLPIAFMVKNKPLTKKEKRRLKKKNR